MRVGDTEIEARSIGGPGEATLVFLHEGLGSVSVWRDFPDRVASAVGLPALVYSRRGYGRSSSIALPRPARFLHDEAAFLPEVLAAAGISRSILVGHSDGASIALLHAAARPSGLLGLAVLAPHVFVEERSLASIEKARIAYATTDLRARLERHHGVNVDVAFRGWNDVWLSPGFRAWNIEAELAKIDVPCAVIQGREDEYGTLAQVASIRARVPDSAVTVLDACGHSPHRDQPERTLAAIEALVRRAGIVRFPPAAAPVSCTRGS